MEALWCLFGKRGGQMRAAYSRASPQHSRCIATAILPLRLPTPYLPQKRCRNAFKSDRIRRNGEVRRDRRHDCVQCRPRRRRPHSRNGDTSHSARQRYCRAIVGTRRGTFPAKKLQEDPPGYNRAAHAGDPVLRKVWFLSIGEGPELLWYAVIRVRQNHMIRCDHCNYWGSRASYFLTQAV